MSFIKQFVEAHPEAAEGKRNRWRLILLHFILKNPGLTRNEILDLLEVSERSTGRSAIDKWLKRLSDEKLLYRERDENRAYVYEHTLTFHQRKVRLETFQRNYSRTGKLYLSEPTELIKEQIGAQVESFQSKNIITEIWDAMPVQMKNSRQ